MDRAGKIRLAVFISDTHSGSTKAILQPGFETLEGQPVGQSMVQQWLWDCWQRAHEWLALQTGLDRYALILNGDLTEGNHHSTKEIWSPEVGDHVKAAKELLMPVAVRAAKVYCVRGTECHVGSGEIGIAHALGAEINPEHGQPFWDRLSLTINGVNISVRHHFPATSRVHLEASQHSIQMGNAILEAVRNGETPPRILVGAHRHRPGHFSDGKTLTVITGAWQAPTRHCYKVVPDARPAPRMYLMDWRAKEYGELPDLSYLDFTAPVVGAVVL